MTEERQRAVLIYGFGWILFSAFLIFGTGIIGDDYSIPYFDNSLHMTIGPVNYLVREPFYRFAESGNYIVIDSIKFLVLLVSMFGCYRFFNLFHRKYLSMLLAFVFVYFPIHDAVTYWYTGQGYLLTCGFYFYAYYLLNDKNHFGSVFFATLASFMGYGSPPFAVGVAYLAYRQLGYRASLLMLLPNIVYLIYYLCVTKIFGVGIDKISNQVDLSALFINVFMQICSAVDALSGPSAWFKVYYSIMELSLISISVVLIFWFFVLRRISFNDVSLEVINKDVATSFFVIMLVSWVMFASTGLYPQTSFNLGDRVTLWGSLLAIYVILTFAVKNKVLYIVTMSIFILSATGISEHWKNWHVTQEHIVQNIRNNADVNSLNKDAVVFVSGNGYSKLGPFSHLEFLSVESYATSIFRHALGRSYHLRVIYIGDNLSVVDNSIVRKGSEVLLRDELFVNFYDSTKNELGRVAIDQFKDMLARAPKDNRHWTQLYGCSVLKSLIESVAPRYQYLCKV